MGCVRMSVVKYRAAKALVCVGVSAVLLAALIGCGVTVPGRGEGADPASTAVPRQSIQADAGATSIPQSAAERSPIPTSDETRGRIDGAATAPDSSTSLSGTEIPSPPMTHTASVALEASSGAGVDGSQPAGTPGGAGDANSDEECRGHHDDDSSTAMLILVTPENFPPPPEQPPDARLIVREPVDPAPVAEQVGIRTGVLWGIEGEDESLTTPPPRGGPPVLSIGQGQMASIELGTLVQPLRIELVMAVAPEDGDPDAEPGSDDFMTFSYDRQKPEQGPCGLQVHQASGGDRYWEFGIPAPDNGGTYYLVVNATWIIIAATPEPKRTRFWREAIWLFGAAFEPAS